jgi:hypothetical protein
LLSSPVRLPLLQLGRPPPSLFCSMVPWLPPTVRSGVQMLTGSQIQEDRLEVWLDGGQLRDIQALIGQQSGDHREIEPAVDHADLESPIG